MIDAPFPSENVLVWVPYLTVGFTPPVETIVAETSALLDHVSAKVKPPRARMPVIVPLGVEEGRAGSRLICPLCDCRYISRMVAMPPKFLEVVKDEMRKGWLGV